jgi:hypothetical protein
MSIFHHEIWYLCSWCGAVTLTDGTERFIGLHLVEYLQCFQLSGTSLFRPVQLFLPYASTCTHQEVLIVCSGGKVLSEVSSPGTLSLPGARISSMEGLFPYHLVFAAGCHCTLP